LFLVTKTNASPYLDSLYEVYSQIPANQEVHYEHRIELLRAISDYELHENPLNALPLIDTLAYLFKLMGNDAQYYRELYRRKGFLYATAQNKLKALEHYQEYVKYCKKESVDDAYFLLDIGNLYYEYSLYSVAKIYYQEAEEIFDRHQYYRGLGTIYSNYSLIAQKQNQIDSALFYIQKTLFVQKEYVKDLLQMAHTYQVLGRIYSERLKSYPKAIINYKKALAIFSDRALHENPQQYNQFILYWPYTSMRLGKAYYQNNQIDSASYYLDSALVIVRTLEKKHAYAFVAVNIADTYIDQGKLQVAEELLLEAEQISSESESHVSLELCYKALTRLYEEKGTYKEALRYARLYEVMRDSMQKKQDHFFLTTDGLLKKEKNERIAQQADVIHAAENARQILYFSLFLLVLILIITWFFSLKLKQKNRTIEQSTKALEENNKIKEIILSVIGHDLRSPFGVITNVAVMLQKKLKGQNNDSLDKLTELLYSTSQKAYSMVDELMQWTTLQKSRPVVQKENVSLEKVVQETIHQLSPLLGQGNVEVKIEVDSVHCWTDPTLMQIILRNILTNAVKYTPFGGLIIIRTQWKDENCVLQVEDGGVGIAPELLEHLFKDKDSLEVVKEASGLGLVIVRDLCERVDWSIRVFNKKGSGAVFELGNLVLKDQLNSIDSTPRLNTSEVFLMLSVSDKNLLEPYIRQLLACEVFEATKIRKIIQEIEKKNEVIVNWLKRLELIINQNDMIAYQDFLTSNLPN
jgi:signal transduction histidine kinase